MTIGKATAVGLPFRGRSRVTLYGGCMAEEWDDSFVCESEWVLCCRVIYR
jgi:hypothetical protein